MPAWPWSYRVSRREETGGSDAATELASLYQRHAAELELGQPDQEPVPRHPYNLLIEPGWFMTVRRQQEHWAGTSVNALGFAGYLLITSSSDHAWLRSHGPLELLQAVAARSD